MITTIPSYVFIITYGLLAAIIAWMMAVCKLQKDNEESFYRKFTKAGWIIFGLLFLEIVVVFFHEINNQNIDHNNTQRLKIEEKLRDSIIAARVGEGVQEANNKLFEDLSSAFKNQNLIIKKLDDKIVVLQDSIKNVKKDVVLPVLRLQLTEVGNMRRVPAIYITDKNSLLINIQSYNATSYNIDLNIFIFSEKSKKIITMSDINCFESPLVENGFRGIEILVSDKIRSYEENVIIVLQGTYSSDPNNENVLNMLEGAIFNFKSEKTLSRIPKDIDKLIKKMN